MLSIKRLCIIQYFFFGFISIVNAQDLSFSKPIVLPDYMATDKTASITLLEDTYVLVWKEKGNNTPVHVTNFKLVDSKLIDLKDNIVAGAFSSFAPVIFRVSSYLYLLWINAEGKLVYSSSLANKNNLLFSEIRIVDTANDNTKFIALSVEKTQNQLFSALVASNKKNILLHEHETTINGYLTIKQKANIRLQESKLSNCSIAHLQNQTVRIAWKDLSEGELEYADYDFAKQKFFPVQTMLEEYSKFSPALLKPEHSNQMYCIAQSVKKGTLSYYFNTDEKNNFSNKKYLPPYIQANSKLSFCHLGEGKHAMVYSNIENKILFTQINSFDPQSWMTEFLLKEKPDYTLQDIVIPGSHDAGMSVLTATGGQQKGTINNCNTLTQVFSIEQQINHGFRMFDVRPGIYENKVYLKHASSNCMEEAIGGGYGESLGSVLSGAKNFLQRNPKEFIIFSFGHFCEKEITHQALFDTIVKFTGIDLLYSNTNREPLCNIPIKQFAGKIILTFEHYKNENLYIQSHNETTENNVLLNYKREYASTNKMDELVKKQESFFKSFNTDLKPNELVRLDWQLTQSPAQAAVICNDFQSEDISPFVSGIMLLTTAIKKYKSIIDMATDGNKAFPSIYYKWVENGTIHTKNKPNILYMDVARDWITSFCINLNQNEKIYNK